MKIPPIQRQSMISAYEKSRVTSARSVNPTMRSDAVEISAGASGFSETFRQVLKAVEQDATQSRAKVETAAKQVRSGEYNVPADQVASAILRGLSLDQEV